jgi:S-DNA-T family DNA segregation ATPase FtsK/SpoIIIE
VQAVMRFSRSNLTSSVNYLVDEGANVERSVDASPQVEPQYVPVANEPVVAQAQPRPRAQHYNPDVTAADEIEGRAEQPVWQRAFLMGPNVRFTRTPHVVDAERRNPTEKTVEMKTETAVSAVESSEVAAPVASAPVSAQAFIKPLGERPIAKPMFIPQPPGATGARALSYRLRRELALQEQQRLQEGVAVPASATEPLIEVAASVPSQTVVIETAAPVQMQTVIAPAEPVVAAEAPSGVETVLLPQSPDVVQVNVAAPIVETPADAGNATSEPHALDQLTASLPDHLFWEVFDAVPHAAHVSEDVAAPMVKQPVALAPVLTVKVPAPEPVLTVTAPVFPSVPLPAHVDSPVALYRTVGVRDLSAAITADAHVSEVEVTAPAIAEPSAVQAAQVEPEQAVAVAQTRRIQPRHSNSLFIEAPTFTEGEYELPPVDLLQRPPEQTTTTMTPEALEQSAGLLESILEDFGVKGEIIDVRPGPVVTLYEFEPAPGVKSSRVIGLSDDIARSMSALSARVAVVPGRNVIGIELPNPVRETVYFRELIESPDYDQTRMKLALCLGKTIGGEPVVAELAKMPHLLVAGTTGSGKSVAINTMILSLLYRLKPEECRLIMVDPKMLELSVYDGIPHLLTPVVTDPKKAVMALKWAVREMEDRYKKMSRLGVRNIDGYNARAASAREKGETVYSTVQTGFDRSTGEAIYEQEEMDLTAMPYIVVIVDEMADLMMVAGKEIEGAIQRLAQMARAAGIHLIMATQRPSVDVITGTIKANFPTRISFQVTSKIDSRTILGEQGAEHLLGQGDMLHMMGGGRISRVHGPFVSDEEVEKVVAHLKAQGRPEYLGTVTEDAEEADAEDAEDAAVFDKTAMGDDDTADLYEKAVKVVLRDKKCSTSYIQRRLSIGYNRAASLVERMEQDGIVGPANHVGKRSIIAGERVSVDGMQSHD